MNISKLIGETTEYEKKEMVEIKKPKNWCKTVSAFANGKGGSMIFGIADDGRVVGVKNPKIDAEIISEMIKAHLDPVPEFNLRIINENGASLIILDIFPGEDTPYYVNIGNMETFVRIGNQSVSADAIDIRRLVLRGYHKTFDSLRSPYRFEDFSFSKLRERYKVWTGASLSEKAIDSFGIREEDGYLTNAGALLADESPIYNSRLFCTRWNGLNKAGGLIDAIDSAEYSGGLINLLVNGMEFVKRNNRTMWRKMPDSRIEMPEYCERSVLEALVNALIHRDYLILGSEVHIDIFDDRMTIYSPGGMFSGAIIQNLNISSVPSARRNPVLADIFNRLGYMERQGSGLNKIVDFYTKTHNFVDGMEPTFYSDSFQFTVTLKNLNYISPKTNEIEYRTNDPNRDPNHDPNDPNRDPNDPNHDPNHDPNDPNHDSNDPNLKETWSLVIDAIKNQPTLTYEQLSIQTGASRKTIQRAIKEMRDAGFIKRVGGTRGHWIIIKEGH